MQIDPFKVALYHTHCHSAGCSRMCTPELFSTAGDSEVLLCRLRDGFALIVYRRSWLWWLTSWIGVAT